MQFGAWSGRPCDGGARGRGRRVRARTRPDRCSSSSPPSAPHAPAIPSPGDESCVRDPARRRGRRPSTRPTSRTSRRGSATCRGSHAIEGGGDRRVPGGPVPVAARRRSGGRQDPRRARASRAAREHADRVHVRQRHPARRAPVDQEGGSVRGGDPRAARDAMGRRGLGAGDRAPGRARAEHRPRADDRRGGWASRTRRPTGGSLLAGPRPATGRRRRADFLIEHMEGENPVPTFCAVRSERWKYVRYATGEEELYDLAADPFELENAAGAPSMRPVLEERRARLRTLCSPVAARLRGSLRDRRPARRRRARGTGAARGVRIASRARLRGRGPVG